MHNLGFKIVRGGGGSKSRMSKISFSYSEVKELALHLTPEVLFTPEVFFTHSLTESINELKDDSLTMGNENLQ